MSHEQPKEFFTPPEHVVSADEIRIRRREALERAKDSGVVSLKPEEGRWLGDMAREAAEQEIETGTHEVPDVAARRAAEARLQEQHAERSGEHVAA